MCFRLMNFDIQHTIVNYYELKLVGWFDLVTSLALSLVIVVPLV